VAVASWLVAAVAVAAAAVSTVYALRRAAPAASPLVLDVNTSPTADPASFALSPDGRVLVYAGLDEGTPVLWLRRLDAPAATRIAGTEGATQPFWAPDGRSIAFFADGLLKRLDLLDGKPRPLAHARNPLGGTWSRDGVIVYAPFAASPLVSVPASGGAAKGLSHLLPHEVSHRHPAFLPDGRRFVFLAIKSAPEGARACLGSLDAPGTPQQLFTADVAPQYVAPGHLLFVRGGALLAIAFDAEHGRVSGEPVELGPRTATFRNKGAFSGSSSGMAAYRVDEGAPRSRLVWVDRAGTVTSTFAAGGFPGLARDGRHIVVNRIRQTPETDSDLWLIDAARPVPARFTFAPANQVNPVWAPDMKSIAFASNRSGVFDLYEKPSGFERDERLLLSTPDNKFPTDWSPDGRVLLFVNDGARTGEDLWTLSLDEPGKAVPFLTQAHSESQGQFSPDGRWVAYRSNETGRWEILLRRYDGSGSQRLVSTGGGIQPRWRSDGKELFYLAADSRLMAVPVNLPQDGDAVTIGEARPLFAVRLSAPTNMQFGYCVDPTGQRFLMHVLEGEPRSTPITIVQNWTAALLEPRLHSGTSRQ
jgi:Tol biopolymer transport system component